MWVVCTSARQMVSLVAVTELVVASSSPESTFVPGIAATEYWRQEYLGVARNDHAVPGCSSRKTVEPLLVGSSWLQIPRYL